MSNTGATALPWETVSRRRSDMSIMRRGSTASRRDSLLSDSLFDFPITPGNFDKPTFGYGEMDPFAPLSLSEPLALPLPLTPVASRAQTVIDRLLGDRSESSGDSAPTVVTTGSYHHLPSQSIFHNDFQPMLAFSNASMMHNQSFLNALNPMNPMFPMNPMNPMDHFQNHKPIAPVHNLSPKMTMESVSSSTTIISKPMASPVKSANKDDDHDDDDDDDDDEESNQHRFKPFHEEKWSLRYKELLAFHKQHGHAAVPHTYPANPQLARWVKRQRRQFKLRRGENRQSTMTQDRLELLTNVGFIWDSHDANWREKLESLAVFCREHGQCNVPSSYCDKKLATWVKCQRRQYKLYWDGKPSAMSPERILELEKVGFEWEIRSAVPRSNGESEGAPQVGSAKREYKQIPYQSV